MRLVSRRRSSRSCLGRRRPACRREHLDRGPVRDHAEHHRDRVPVRLAVLVHDRRRSDLQAPGRTGAFAQVSAAGGVPLNDIEFQTRRPDRHGRRQRRPGAAVERTAATAGPPITGIKASAPSSTFLDCKTRGADLGDLNAVRFAGNDRVWIFAEARRSSRSQPADRGATSARRRAGAWTDANRDTHGHRHGTWTTTPASSTRRTPRAIADAFFATPRRRLHRRRPRSPRSSSPPTTSRRPRQKQPAYAGNAGDDGRVIAGDPVNPSRMWSVNATPLRPLHDRRTRATAGRPSDWFHIGNDSGARRSRAPARPTSTTPAAPSSPPATAGLVAQLHRRRQLLLQRRRRGARHAAAGTRSASPAPPRRRSAATTASSRSRAPPTSIPAPPAPPVVVPITKPVDPPTTTPLDSRPLPTFTLTGAGNGATAKISGGKVKIVVKGKIKVPSGVNAKTRLHRHGQHDDQEGQDAAHARATRSSARSAPSPKTISLVQEQGRQREDA